MPHLQAAVPERMEQRTDQQIQLSRRDFFAVQHHHVDIGIRCEFAAPVTSERQNGHRGKLLIQVGAFERVAQQYIQQSVGECRQRFAGRAAAQGPVHLRCFSARVAQRILEHRLERGRTVAARWKLFEKLRRRVQRIGVAVLFSGGKFGRGGDGANLRSGNKIVIKNSGFRERVKTHPNDCGCPPFQMFKLVGGDTMDSGETELVRVGRLKFFLVWFGGVCFFSTILPVLLLCLRNNEFGPLQSFDTLTTFQLARASTIMLGAVLLAIPLTWFSWREATASNLARLVPLTAAWGIMFGWLNFPALQYIPRTTSYERVSMFQIVALYVIAGASCGIWIGWLSWLAKRRERGPSLQFSLRTLLIAALAFGAVLCLFRPNPKQTESLVDVLQVPPYEPVTDGN